MGTSDVVRIPEPLVPRLDQTRPPYEPLRPLASTFGPTPPVTISQSSVDRNPFVHSLMSVNSSFLLRYAVWFLTVNFSITPGLETHLGFPNLRNVRQGYLLPPTQELSPRNLPMRTCNEQDGYTLLALIGRQSRNSMDR